MKRLHIRMPVKSGQDLGKHTNTIKHWMIVYPSKPDIYYFS